MLRRVFGAVALASVLVIPSCSDDAPLRPPQTTPQTSTSASIFVVPSSLEALAADTFFDHPFPSDLRRESDGTVRFVGWPNPGKVPLLSNYVNATSNMLDGFSPIAPIYFRFTGAIDTGTLPNAPPAATTPDSAVQLIDVDPASPERGQRRLIQTYWQETAAEGSLWQPFTLSIMPMLGRPLRPKTRYAAVVTKRLRAKDGTALSRAPDLEEVLGERPASTRTQKAKELFAPAVDALAKAGVAATDIVHLTVFTTLDPTAELFAVADDVAASVPAPTATGWTAKETSAAYEVYEGTYGPSPNYQQGKAPYAKASDGGAFSFEAGRPKLQGTFDLRFALVVPKSESCPPPETGYPVVLYAHGTGGNYRSFIEDRTAQALAERCLASMGIDQIFHGTRPGAPAADDPTRDARIELLFFNFENPFAARTNNRQSAIDVVQQARLFSASKTSVPASVARGGKPIAFDPTRVLFFGHSQGGLNGPLFLSASDVARGGVLSGAGSVITSALLEKTKPIDIPAVLRVLLGLTDPERAKELVLFHPALALAQSLIDVSDPIHYGAFITTNPRTGHTAKSIYQTEGVAADGTGDTYAPPSGIEALAISMSLPRLAPGTRLVVEAQWAGIPDVTLGESGLRGNLAGGKATGVLAQFAPRAGSDGHFVVFDVPAARAQAASFCQELAADPIGRLLSP